MFLGAQSLDHFFFKFIWVTFVIRYHLTYLFLLTTVRFSKNCTVTAYWFVTSKKFSKWCKDWLLTLSPSKSATIFSSRKNKILPYSPVLVNNTVIKQVDRHKHLGIVLNKTLSWSDQINKISTKAMKRVHLLHLFKYKMRRSALRRWYLSLWRSRLEFEDVIGLFTLRTRRTFHKILKFHSMIFKTCLDHLQTFLTCPLGNSRNTTRARGSSNIWNIVAEHHTFVFLFSLQKHIYGNCYRPAYVAVLKKLYLKVN